MTDTTTDGLEHVMTLTIAVRDDGDSVLMEVTHACEDHPEGHTGLIGGVSRSLIDACPGARALLNQFADDLCGLIAKHAVIADGMDEDDFVITHSSTDSVPREKMN